MKVQILEVERNIFGIKSKQAIQKFIDLWDSYYVTLSIIRTACEPSFWLKRIEESNPTFQRRLKIES